MEANDIELDLEKETAEKVKEEAQDRAEIIEERMDGDMVYMRLRFSDVDDRIDFCDACCELIEPQFENPPEDFDPSEEVEET